MTNPDKGPEQYVFGSILIHLRCSNKCVFCDFRLSDSPDDLTQEQEIQLFKDTAYFYENNFTAIDVSGSEPLRYSKIIPYLHRICSMFKRVIILDPGNSLHNEQFTKDIVKTGFYNIVIPIYGSTPKVHDSCVCNPGAHGKVIKGLRNLIKYKLPDQHFELTSVFLKQNINDIPKLARFIQNEYGINSLKINAPTASEEVEGIGGKKFSDFNVPFGQIRKAIIKLADIKGMGYDFHYTPLCIFSDKELLMLMKRRGVTFFNMFYTYNLSDTKANQNTCKYVERYRAQVFHDKCDQCYLKKAEICLGVRRMHYTANKNYNYNPISKKIYAVIKPIITVMKVNQ